MTMTAHRTLADIDLHSLRLLADHLADTPAPLRVTAPRDLNACSVCPEHWLLDPNPSVAEIVYTAPGGWVYREPACEMHVRPAVRWHQRLGKTVHVDIPAPHLHYTEAAAA